MIIYSDNIFFVMGLAGLLIGMENKLCGSEGESNLIYSKIYEKLIIIDLTHSNTKGFVSEILNQECYSGYKKVFFGKNSLIPCNIDCKNFFFINPYKINKFGILSDIVKINLDGYCLSDATFNSKMTSFSKRSKRQLEVISLMMRGYSECRISSVLNIKKKSVCAIIRRLTSSFGFRNKFSLYTHLLKK